MINKNKSIIISFFTKGHERTLLAKKNIATSFLIKIVTVMTSFISYPLTLKYLNPDRNGIWLALYSIISWVLIFDIGLGNGLKNKFAECKAKGELLLARKYVSSTYIIFGIILFAFVVLFSIVNPYIDWAKLLNTPPIYAHELTTLAWIMFFNMSLMLILRLIISITNGDQRIALGSFIDMAGQLLSLIGIIILVYTTEGSLIKISWIMGGAPIIVYLIASIILFKGRYKIFRPSLKLANFGLSKQMVNLGIKFFIATLSSLILFQTTNMLISRIINPYEVTIYNTAFKIFCFGYSLLAIFIAPYWSAYSDAFTLKDYNWMKRSFRKLISLFGLFLLIELLLLIMSNWIYLYWIKNIISIPFTMSVSVFLYICGIGWTTICIYPINGMGKMKLQLYSSIFEMIVVIPLAIYLGKQIGAIGIVLAPVLVSIPRMIWAPIQVNKLVSGKAKGIWNK